MVSKTIIPGSSPGRPAIVLLTGRRLADIFKTFFIFYNSFHDHPRQRKTINYFCQARLYLAKYLLFSFCLAGNQHLLPFSRNFSTPSEKMKKARVIIFNFSPGSFTSVLSSIIPMVWENCKPTGAGWKGTLFTILTIFATAISLPPKSRQLPE